MSFVLPQKGSYTVVVEFAPRRWYLLGRILSLVTLGVIVLWLFVFRVYAQKNAKSIINKRSHVLIATFSPWKNGVRLPINGNLEPMRDYFVPRVKKVVLIDQVYPGE